jgi:hypothetical protein
MSSIPTRPASTVVLLRPADPFEVFLVRRSDSIAFMGGAHVFPGGRVDEDDRLHDIDALSVGAEAAAARMSDVLLHCAGTGRTDAGPRRGRDESQRMVCATRRHRAMPSRVHFAAAANVDDA